MSTGTYTSSLGAPGHVASLWRYRELLKNLVIRDIKVRYKRSVLGFLWMLVNPLVAMIVYTLIFSEMFKMGNDYALYVLSALLFFNFFGLGTTQGLSSILFSGGIIRRVAVPKAVFPLASVLANLVNFGLSLVPLFVVMLYIRGTASPALLVLPIPILAATCFTLGVSLLLATATVFYRDVRWFYESFLLILYFATPIIYPPQAVPERAQFLIRYNPLAQLLEPFRAPIHQGSMPAPETLAVSLAIGLGALALGWVVFHRFEDRFIDYV